MAIYDFPDAQKGELKLSAMPQRCLPEEGVPPSEIDASQPPKSARGQIFSAIAARLFFLLLVVADLMWIGYSFAVFIFTAVGYGVTRGRTDYFKNKIEKAWVTLRRSIVCGVSLMVALFSPAFGIMIACTYFLMYDKTGIEEVIPSSLQSQFKEFLPQGVREEK